MKKVLIVDDNPLWVSYGKALLEKAGYEVTGLVTSEQKEESLEYLSEAIMETCQKIDVLLTDKDLGGGKTSTGFICIVRYNLPKLPIIRWTGGREEKPYMQYLGVSCMGKPTKLSEDKFVEEFQKLYNEQLLILSGPMGIFASLDETVTPNKYAAENRAKRLTQIAQIAQLAEKDSVDSGERRYPWTITGETAGPTKHELGHCICDGDLTIEDIRPHLPALQKVIAKFESVDGIDHRFKTCAEFLKGGKLEELEFVHRCY